MAMTAMNMVNGGGGAPTLDQLLYNSNKTLLGSITTYGGSYTATEDCVMYAKCSTTSGSSLDITINSKTVLSGNTTLLAGYYSKTDSAPTGYGVFIPKGTTVNTRNTSGMAFSLDFYTLD